MFKIFPALSKNIYFLKNMLKIYYIIFCQLMYYLKNRLLKSRLKRPAAYKKDPIVCIFRVSENEFA